VVRASVDFVRVIVRRPHAYFFIEDLFEDRGGIRSATPAGCRLADGSTAPLPGLYFLDADGGHLRSVALQGADAQAVLEAMGAATAR